MNSRLFATIVAVHFKYTRALTFVLLGNAFLKRLSIVAVHKIKQLKRKKNTIIDLASLTHIDRK
jgi:hypothetical protein